MLFNSLEFLLFLPIVVIIYYILPKKFRWIMLLTASYFFYMYWKWQYVILIIVSTLIDFFVSIQMHKQTQKKYRRLLLIVSLATNLGILFVFKYYNFFNDILVSFSAGFRVSTLLLPMGISFYTFQTLSYTIDVYRNKREPETHLGYFALYVTYFPQLVAGPIERSDVLIPQLKKDNMFDYDNVSKGLKMMLLGFFKKCVIADNISPVVDSIYGNVYQQNGTYLIFGIVLFSLQIYCDFSGYSDIAIGTSKLMGIKLMDNFKRPYLSRSLKDFWNRWHISLSTWFKDYLYIPLGGNRKSDFRTLSNLIVTFIVSGFWHGANWTFLAWGLIHGVFQTIGNLTKNIKKKIWVNINLDKSLFQMVVQMFTTYALVCFAWLFFRAENINDTVYILKSVNDVNISHIFSLAGIFGGSILRSMPIWIGILLLVVYEVYYERFKISIVSKFSSSVRMMIYIAAICYILIYGNFGYNEFIYFQF